MVLLELVHHTTFGTQLTTLQDWVNLLRCPSLPHSAMGRHEGGFQHWKQRHPELSNKDDFDYAILLHMLSSPDDHMLVTSDEDLLKCPSVKVLTSN